MVLGFVVARKHAAILLAISFFAPALLSATSDEASRQKFLQTLVAAATERSGHSVRYEPAYVVMPYPGGDVPATTGVCTDEIIRSYRALGIDLQKEVHEDMTANFATYPRKWHRTRPDSNIDHRRVPNLQVFFSRKGETLPITGSARDYAPGDLVTWDLGGGLTHIGIVVNSKAFFSSRNKILHNIGAAAGGNSERITG